MKKRLIDRLIIPISLLLMTIVVILSIATSVNFQTSSSLLINEKLSANINSLNLHLENSLNNSRAAAVSMSKDPAVISAIKNKDTYEIVRLLDPAYDLYLVNYFNVTDMDGNVIARTYDPDNHGDSLLYQRNIMDARMGITSSYYEVGTSVKVAARTGAPVYDVDGTLIGVISAGVRFDTDETVDELKHLLNNTEVTVFLGDLRIATTLMYDGHRAEGTTLDPDIAKILIEDKQEYSGRVSLFGLIYETYYRPLLNANDETFAIVFLGIPVDDLIRDSNILFVQAIVISIIGFTVSLILLKALRDAMAANRAKSNFLANMSHEIRTPINAIIGMTSIAESTDDNDRRINAIGSIKDASSNLLDIVNDILDMSKIEANKLELMPVEFSLEKVLRGVINILQFRINEKQQVLTIEYDSSIPRVLIGDDKRLTQVLINLMGNAVKFTPDKGAIGISARSVKLEHGTCTVQVDVSDTGIGVSKEQHERLFNSFEQAESSTSRKFGGTGLGLAISKRIIEMMGGEIWLVSDLGKGSVFSFTIKARVADVLPNDSASSELDDSSRDERPQNAIIADCFIGRRILLAEDVEINREILLALLEPTSLEIDCAENGYDAVSMFIKNSEMYDLIFMDIQMPEMDGFEATRMIRASASPRAKEIPIIAFSANAFKEDVEESMKAGMNMHISKPVDVNEVMRILTEYLC